MKLYSLSDVKIAPDRQRQEFDPDALEELKNSIADRGLMHAPVVRETENGIFLVAGERRLRAITDLYALDQIFKYNGHWVAHGQVPCVTLGELDELEAEEAELDENLKRKNLTWQEEAAAHERLHKLRQKQLDKKVTDMMDSGELRLDSGVEPRKQTAADTARELYPKELTTRDAAGGSGGYLQDKVRKELIVAQHLNKPEIAKAKDVHEAFKILKRSEEQERNRDLAAEVGKTFTAEKHRVFHAPCTIWMAEAIKYRPEELFDVILTDPPYGMGADEFGDGGGKLTGIEHEYKDDYEHWKELMTTWTKYSYWVAKPEAHAYVFCDIDRYHELKLMMELAGWYVHRTPLIDYKTDSGRVPLPERGPRRCWEMILYAIKGNKPVTHIYPDVIPCQADEQMGHGAQKPIGLYVNLLRRSIKPGDRVLDSFAGSGTIIPACHSLQCEATAIEQEAASYGMCLKRLQALKNAVDPLAELMANVAK